MKCPYCKAATQVLEVRERKGDGGMRRTRQCYNEHTFTTLETVFLAANGRPPLNGHALRAQAVDLDARYANIIDALSAGQSIHQVMERFGVSERTAKRAKQRGQAQDLLRKDAPGAA